jgi:hypothetical protein
MDQQLDYQLVYDLSTSGYTEWRIALIPSGQVHQTLPHGGPIRPGQRVRIRDFDGTIVRLEIAR